MSEMRNTRVRYGKVLKSKYNKYMSLDHSTGKYFWSKDIGDASCWVKGIQEVSEINLFTKNLDNLEGAELVGIVYTAKIEEE